MNAINYPPSWSCLMNRATKLLVIPLAILHTAMADGVGSCFSAHAETSNPILLTAEERPETPAPSTAPVQGDEIRPFKIQVDDAVLRDLHDRLARTRLPVTTDNGNWDYGPSLDTLREMLEYWRTKYDWRKQEERLNQFHQFVTNIDGLDIHFIHERSKEESALPLVIIHGWPGSVVEFTKIIGPLTDPV